MKGKARRLLSWVCVLALCMSLLPVTALATTGSGTQEKPVTNTENQVTVNKWVSTDEDGNYRLNMEAYASNVVTTESKTTPLDIVLVLDQSGSMSDSYHSSWWHGDSKLSMLKKAATSFVKKVAQNAQENEVSHRIAVVGFASTGNKYSGYKNTGLFVDGEFKNYGDLRSNDYKNALVSVTNNQQTITWAINSLDAEGDTYSEYGMDMANNIFANNSDSNNERHRVVVMFTDGYTAPSGTDDFKYSMANSAIAKAYETKNTYNADVYTIGLFSGANPEADITESFQNDDEWNDWGNKNNLTDNQETVAANRYMHYVSSNYPSVTSLQDNGVRAEGSSYYMAVNDSTSLDQIFSDIAEDITKNSLEVYPDKDAELTDTLSQYFDFPKGLTGNSEKITVKYVPVDKKTGAFEEALAVNASDVTIKVNGDTITITGFNYVENAVTLENGEYSGGKLVVSFPIELDAAECGYQGGTYPTNDTTKDKAGLYYKDEQGAPQNNESTLLDKSPKVTVDASQVERQGTAINIKVVVDGTPMSEGDVDDYVTVTPSGGQFNENNDTVTYTFTYYDCKDIDFAAQQGYVIEAVDADLVYGQSECKGITDNNGTVTADNVQGGSIVTVYVRTLYTIQYHNGESIITENTVNLVAETSSLEPKTPTVEKPIVDAEYDGEKYIQVGQEDTHAPATPSGKQAPSDFTYVNNGLKTSEKIKALPTDDSGQLMYSGWYVGGSEYLLAPGTDFQNEQYNFETYDKYDRDDNVINLYCTSAAARHQINISFEDDSQEPTTLKEMHTEEQSHNYQYNFAPSREENAVVPMTISYDSQTYVFDHFNGNNSGTLTGDVEFTAVYSVDSNNNGVPDKYEATVTYRVVNGTWNDDTNGDKTETFAMRSFDSDSNTWVEINPVPTLDDQDNTIPTGMKPDIGYDANSGSWDIEPTGDTSVVNGTTYTYTFKDQLNYTVTIEYKDEEGNTLANNETISNQIHGSTVDLTAHVKNTIINGDNTYVRVNTTSEPSVTITENTFTITANTTITYVYALDNWNDEDDTETGGDNIPDKYQALVKFAANENGTVSGNGTTQVFTLKNGDAYAESGKITPVEDGITIAPNEGYAFDIWTEGEGGSAVNPFTERTVTGGTTIIFYANFAEDKIGGEEGGGDGTPDKYQAKVTYKVVGGTWSENGTGTVEKVYTLYKKNNEDGKWTQIDPVPTIPERDIPDIGEITPKDQYMLPGTWDTNPAGKPVDADSSKNVYTYTLTQQAPSVKVEKRADPTSVKVGETINYTVTVTNDGNVKLTDVAVQDEMMSSKTATVTAKDSTGAEVALDGTWNGSTYTIANLPVAVTYTFEYSYTATENDVKSGVSNTVTVDAPNLPEDPSDTVKVQVLDPKIDIEKALTAVNGEGVPTDYNAQVGDELTYTITVNNIGNTAFTGITVTDTMWGSDKVTSATFNMGIDQEINVSNGSYTHEQVFTAEAHFTITYTYTVQSSDIGTNEISNTASVSTGTDPDDPKDEDTVTVRMDDYTVTITPADITIYTGGEDYSGVVDGSGNLIGSTETNTGLPEPGYHITLPAAVTEWLNDKEGGEGSTGEDAARDLANYMTFTYDVGETTREWGMQYQGVYSTNPETGEVRQYVYSLTAGKTEDNKEIPVRLQFKNGDQVMTSDDFDMSAAQVHQTYDMTIYSGELEQGQIKAKLTVGEEGTEQSISCDIKIGSGELTIRSVVDKIDNTNAIAADENAVTDTETATAVPNGDVDYYVNDSKVEVKNEGDRVQLLVDQVSDNTDFNAAMGNDAVAKVNAALEEGNTLSNAAYDLAYMDLVDTQNGNTVVTMGDNQSLFIYWPVPEDAAEDSAFHVVHYYELDREEVTNADDLGEATTQKVDTKEVNGQSYVVFETSSFSPFALVYEKAPDPVASLDVTKTLTAVNGKTPGSSVSVGDTLTYTITVKNGEVALKDVTITDTFTGKGDLNFRLPDGATVSENQDGTYTITLGDLTAGQEVTITATYKVLRADASSDLTNAVKVNGTNPGGGENPTDEDKTPETPVNPYHPPIRPPVDPDKPELNTEDHYAYIVGYEDGSVQPEGDITRAEVATIFFRLLTDESRNEYWSQTNPYSDVSADDWFNNAVSTLTNAGVLDGYEDGTFKPNGNITRAEFATITARFFEATYDGENLFPDIEGHWAQDYINEAANAGIVNGYEDGTFRPQQYITRAEAVTMVNRTIERHPDADHLLDDMIVWPDNPETAWYYEQIQEATNSHEYTMNTDDEQNPYEIWTKLLPNRDWSELEKEWSDANDGAGSGEVV